MNKNFSLRRNFSLPLAVLFVLAILLFVAANTAFAKDNSPGGPLYGSPACDTTDCDDITGSIYWGLATYLYNHTAGYYYKPVVADIFNRIDLYLFKRGTPTDDVYVEIWDRDTPSIIATSSLVSSSNILDGSGTPFYCPNVSTCQSYKVTFGFASDVSLASTTVDGYTIKFRRTGSDDNTDNYTAFRGMLLVDGTITQSGLGNVGLGSQLYPLGSIGDGIFKTWSVISISDDILATTTWNRNAVYVVSGDVEIASGVTLTLEPGVVVKFATATSSLTVNGTLNAIGGAATEDETTVNEIYLTSLLDDAAPPDGDTNNDGLSTSPAAGDWKGVIVGAGGVANLEYVTIRYGGALSGTEALLQNNGGALLLSTSTLAHGTTYGIKNTSGTTTVLGSSVGFNDYGLYLAGGSMSITASSTIHDNSTYGIYNNTTNIIDATNNWWLAISGPYHSVTHATGTGNRISDYVDYNPWIGMDGNGVHYLTLGSEQGCLDGCGMANGDGLLLWRWNASTTPKYEAELADAIQIWEDIGTSTTFAVSGTSSSAMELFIVNRTDVVWSGQSSTEMLLNEYYLDQDTSAQIQHTITHEFGHALGLSHSFPGNILYSNQTSLTELGTQDLFDYHYLWD